MGWLQTVWSSVLSTWIRVGTALFPRTLHPEIVHFPIVLLYLALFIQVVGHVTGSVRQSFVQRSGFWVLTLALPALAAAAAAGVLAEQYVRWTPQTAPLLYAHQRDAAITGVLALAAWTVRILTRGRASVNRRGALGRPVRGRSSLLSDLLLAGAVAMVTATGSLGGAMVYQYGVGTPMTLTAVRTNTRGVPSAAGSASSVRVDHWLAYSPSKRTVYLLLRAGLQDGYDFNGYANGAMTVTVPLHWTIAVSVVNASSYLNHSAVIVPLSEIATQNNLAPAFPGASLPDPVAGISPGASAHFSFAAARTGRYAVTCGVPGHAALGMWDHFNVSGTARTPAIALAK